MNLVEKEIERRNQSRSIQAQWAMIWHKVARFCAPEKAAGLRALAQSATGAVTKLEPQVSNSTAMDGLRICSGGVKQWTCPGVGSGCFGWTPSPWVGDQIEVKEWLNHATRVADGQMGGFYSKVDGTIRDLLTCGIGAIFVQEGKDATFAFQALSPSEFVYSRDFDGKPDAVAVTYWKTAKELHGEFGKDCPACVTRDIVENKPDQKHEVIHSVVMRENPPDPRWPGDPTGMLYASVWIHVGEKHLLREGGFEEMPFAIPRWEVPTGGDGLYGVSPGMYALADVRGVNLLDMLAGTWAEIQVNPRFAAPPGAGALDLSPGGLTPIQDMNSMPVEIGTKGQFGAVDDYIDRKEKQILRHFHADLFERLGPIAQQREITNGVAQMLQEEALPRISPAMGAIFSELMEPILHFVFMTCYRKGMFGRAPDAAFYVDPITNRRALLFPKVAHTSRMARALNSRKAGSFNAAMGRVLPLAETQPDLLDHYDFPVILRELDDGDGFPTGWHRSLDKVAQMQQQRAEQAQQAQMMQAGIDAASKNPELAMEALGQA